MMDLTNLNQAERELILALSPGEGSDPNLRQADWAQWWGPSLIETCRELLKKVSQ